MQATQKKFRRLSVQPGLRGRNDLRFGRKVATFQLFFSVQGTGGSSTGPDPENRAGDQDIGRPGRPVSLGCKCPLSRGIFVQEQDTLGEIRAAFCLQNVLQLHQQRCVILRIDSLALWKIINEEDAILIPKKSRRELFQRNFVLVIFWGRGEPLRRHSIDCCFVSGSY